MIWSWVAAGWHESNYHDQTFFSSISILATHESKEWLYLSYSSNIWVKWTSPGESPNRHYKLSCIEDIAKSKLLTFMSHFQYTVRSSFSIFTQFLATKRMKWRILTFGKEQRQLLESVSVLRQVDKMISFAKYGAVCHKSSRESNILIASLILQTNPLIKSIP